MSSKHEKRLLHRAIGQIESRKGGYNGRENSFEYIARRWTTWIRNNLTAARIAGILEGKDGLEPWEVAALMSDFKLGRKEARKAAGAEAHPDDDEDAAAYLDWADMLNPDVQTAIPFEPRKVSDK